MENEAERQAEERFQPLQGLAKQLLKRAEPAMTISGNVTRGLVSRITFQAGHSQVWTPDAGPVSPVMVEKFTGKIMERYPALARKFAVETMPQEGGEAEDLVLPPLSPIFVRGGKAPRAAETRSSGQFPPALSFQEPNEPVTAPKTIIASPPPVQRKPGVRPRSSLEVISAPGSGLAGDKSETISHPVQLAPAAADFGKEPVEDIRQVGPAPQDVAGAEELPPARTSELPERPGRTPHGIEIRRQAESAPQPPAPVRPAPPAEPVRPSVEAPDVTERLVPPALVEETQPEEPGFLLPPPAEILHPAQSGPRLQKINEEEPTQPVAGAAVGARPAETQPQGGPLPLAGLPRPETPSLPPTGPENATVQKKSLASSRPLPLEEKPAGPTLAPATIQPEAGLERVSSAGAGGAQETRVSQSQEPADILAAPPPPGQVQRSQAGDLQPAFRQGEPAEERIVPPASPQKEMPGFETVQTMGESAGHPLVDQLFLATPARPLPEAVGSSQTEFPLPTAPTESEGPPGPAIPAQAVAPAGRTPETAARKLVEPDTTRQLPLAGPVLPRPTAAEPAGEPTEPASYPAAAESLAGGKAPDVPIPGGEPPGARRPTSTEDFQEPGEHVPYFPAPPEVKETGIGVQRATQAAPLPLAGEIQPEIRRASTPGVGLEQVLKPAAVSPASPLPEQPAAVDAALPVYRQPGAPQPVPDYLPTAGVERLKAPETGAIGSAASGLAANKVSQFTRKEPQITTVGPATAVLPQARGSIQRSPSPAGQGGDEIGEGFEQPLAGYPAQGPKGYANLPLVTPALPEENGVPIQGGAQSEMARGSGRFAAPLAGQIQRQVEPTAAEEDTGFQPFQIVQRVTTVEPPKINEQGEAEPADLDDLARKIYPLIKRMLAIERERFAGR